MNWCLLEARRWSLIFLLRNPRIVQLSVYEGASHICYLFLKISPDWTVPRDCILLSATLLISPISSYINPAFKYFINLVRVHRNLSFTCTQSNAFAENRFGYVVKQQSQNPLLMEFSEFTSGASPFKRGRCNERRNEKQLRLLSRDRTQRLSTLNAHGRTCGAAPLRGSRERRWN